MKQFGVTKPRSFDYFLSFAFALMGLSSLWVGIWVAAGGGWDLSLEAIDLSIRALSGSFAGVFAPYVAIMSVMFYVGMLFSLTMLVFALIKKDYRALAGCFALILLATAFACQIGFVLTFYSVFSGLFTSFLTFFMLAELIIAVMNIKLLWHRVVMDSKFYEEYVLDYPEAEFFDCSCEACQEEQEVKEEPKPKKEAKEEPKAEEIKEESKEEPKEEPKEEESEEEPEEEIEEGEELDYEDDLDGDIPQDAGGFANMKAKQLTFEQKLRRAKPIARERFKEIKSHFESLGFKAVRTKHAETFVYKNNKYAQIMMSGKTGLKIYYRLDAKDYENSAIPVASVENIKKYENTPLLFSVKSDLSVKRAKKLMEDVAKNLEK